ncbi:hypothetical protein HJC23_004865 [Cyclotella cryptica]|uniref:Wax synthase domain-containing protein n=1 Tax=Cyclotella cryptica TaxID=29204 RepID=A0ABD3P7B9_9STRA
MSDIRWTVSINPSTLDNAHPAASTEQLPRSKTKETNNTASLSTVTNKSHQIMSVHSIGKRIGETLLFSARLESDERTPFLTVSVPPLLLGGRYDGHDVEMGLILPSVEFWVALVMILFIGCAFNLVLSIISYYYIVLPRKRQRMLCNGKRQTQTNNKRTSEDSMTPYLVGFGIVMPIAILSPYYCIQYFGVRNKVLKFFFGVQSVTTYVGEEMFMSINVPLVPLLIHAFFMFHIPYDTMMMIAMFGFLPKHVEDSLFNTVVYNIFPVEIKYDDNGPLRSTWIQSWYYARKFVLFLVLLGGYSSFLSAYDYELFAVGEDATLWDAGRLANNALVALLFQLYLTTHGYGIFTITSLCGVQQEPIMLNPIFESSSPSDFWGRRWNMVVHGMLKRGVYKPVRSKHSRLVASTATFVASGMFHEWLLSIVFLPDNPPSPNSYRPIYGQNTAFFIWNAFIIGLEYSIGATALFQLLKSNLPATILSLLVASTALPMAHWFTLDYVKSDFFHDGQIGFPQVVLRNR